MQRKVIGFSSLKENFPVPVTNQNKQTFRNFTKCLPINKDLRGAKNRNTMTQDPNESDDHFRARKCGQCANTFYNGCFNYLTSCRLHLVMNLGALFINGHANFFDSYGRLKWYSEHLWKCCGLKHTLERVHSSDIIKIKMETNYCTNNKPFFHFIKQVHKYVY